MNKEELCEAKEYHYRKIRRKCQTYIDNELDYKINKISDIRLLEVGKLIKELLSEKERINEIDNLIYEFDNKEVSE